MTVGQQTCRLNGLSPTTTLIAQPRPNSSMSNEAHQQQLSGKVPIAIQVQPNLITSGTKQVIYYQQALTSGNQLQMANNNNNNNNVNSTAGNNSTQSNNNTLNPQPLQYKTISMPNVALLKSCPQVITLISSKDAHNLQEPPKIQLIASPNKHPNLISSNVNAQDLSICKSDESNNKNGSNSNSSAVVNSNSNNNPDLVKDAQNRAAASAAGSASIKSDSIKKADEVCVSGNSASSNSNKDGLIFYSMNV